MDLYVYKYFELFQRNQHSESEKELFVGVISESKWQYFILFFITTTYFESQYAHTLIVATSYY
jgi:hypothetical protein